MDNNQRSIGLHVRLQDGLRDIVEAVEQYKIVVAQSFLLNENGRYISLGTRAISQFLKQKESLQFDYFVHAAYWSSLTDMNSKEFLSLVKESEIAVDLQSKGIVVHVGATRGNLTKSDQAKYVAQGINELLHRVPDATLLLENAPHAGRNFGGDLLDFVLLYEMLEQAEKVQYCIDTAHAFVYGYNLADQAYKDSFFETLDTYFKDKNISLLHLNDTQHGCASQIDKHEVPGKGEIGSTVLKACMQQTILHDVPIVLELPGYCEPDEIHATLARVRSWDIEK